MDKGSRSRWFPWLFPNQPKLRILTLYVAVPAAIVFTIARIGLPMTDLLLDYDGSDDRPPIIISSGSVDFDGGDPSDNPTIKGNWRDWTQDLFSSHWKPDFPKGKNVNRYDVTVTSGGKACGPLTGGVVVVQYTRTDGGTPSPVDFTLNTHPWGGFGRVEPKLDPGSIALTPTAVGRDASGAPTTPARLDFGAKGYISQLTVSPKGGGNQSICTFSDGDKPKIRVEQFDK